MTTPRTTQSKVWAAAMVLILLSGMVGISARSSWAAAPPAETVDALSPAAGLRWAFYVTYSANSWDSLQANVKSLNYVSPWYFYLHNDGTVRGTDEARTSSLLRQNRVKNLPMLKNDAAQGNDFTSVMTDTAHQTLVIDQIDSLVSANRYDGITIDFEALNPADKPLLSAFMKGLYARLHAEGKQVAIAVPAKAKDSETGWSGAYDYRALAASSDYVLIMAYDYHWANSDPGPIAPMSELGKTADYTLSRIPAKKVIWGIGVYGYDWATKDTGQADGKAEYRTFAEADAIAKAPDSQSGYDTTAESPFVLYTRDGKPREVWYEDRRSFDAKMGFIKAKGISAFGIWRLGQEDPAIWRTVSAARFATACTAVKAFQSTSTKVYFSQTGHTLSGVFLKYWQSHGGLPVFGYPLTEEFSETSPTNGRSYKVQYFERNRFEYHPENDPPNDVQLGLLGVQAAGNRVFAPAANPSPGPDTVYFPQVQHTLGGAFLTYWQAHGSLAQFGYPISEPVIEQSATDGKTYLVQYLQRARFELHPEYAGTAAEVLLGLLGRDAVPCR